uniref:Protein kinase domain-containing protein n=1 Tax=Neobodo designis TaxID=312471 RepID=A0A7S1WAQ1_NEODS|mmetsp:Transcript_9465/g.29282  ORF Transcript_9465/g.29282 Transcript_9465/m.29282 type:complete len:343 (+) Transcript_9465:44-1072(+)
MSSEVQMQRIQFPSASGASFFADSDSVTKVLWDPAAPRPRSLLRKRPSDEALRWRAVTEVTIANGLSTALRSRALPGSLTLGPEFVPLFKTTEASEADMSCLVSLSMRRAACSLADCRTAFARLEASPADRLAAVARVGCQVSTQLAILHSGILVGGGSDDVIRVVHGDVAPGNIVLDRDGAAHLIDFGCARWLCPMEDRREGTSTAEADVPRLLRFSSGGFTPQVADQRLIDASACGCDNNSMGCDACRPFRIGAVPVAPDGVCDTHALVETLTWWCGDFTDAGFLHSLTTSDGQAGDAERLVAVFAEYASPAGDVLLRRVAQTVAERECVVAGLAESDSD